MNEQRLCMPPDRGPRGGNPTPPCAGQRPAAGSVGRDRPTFRKSRSRAAPAALGTAVLFALAWAVSAQAQVAIGTSDPTSSTTLQGTAAASGGQAAVAVGFSAVASQANTTAVGAGAQASTQAGDVALGSGSVTGAVHPTGSGSLNGTTYSYAGGTPASVVSIGAAGAERQLTNVAAGQVSATSTDAVNGSQLNATNQALSAIANGGGIRYFHTNAAGADSQAQSTNGIAVGPNAVAAGGAGTIVIGNNASSTNSLGVNRNNSNIVIGQNANTTTQYGGTVVMGDGANTQVGRSVAIGYSASVTNSSVGTAATSTGTYQIGGVAIGDRATAVVDGSTVGAGYYTPVAIGEISRALSDGAIAMGEASTAASQMSISIGTDSSASANRAVVLGANASATGYRAMALGAAANVSVANGVALGADSVSDRAVAPATGSVPAGVNSVQYNTADRTLLGAVSVGSSTSYRQITNVADATQSQDAVTLRQLTGAMTSFATTTTRYFHANSSNPSGSDDSLAIGANSVAVGPNTVVNADNGTGIGNGATVGSSAPGGVAIGQGAQSQAADSVAISSGATANGVQSLALGAGATANHALSVALGAGSVTTVGAQTGYAAYGLSDPQNSVGEIGVGTVNGARQVTGVAAGSADTDAVNVQQLRSSVGNAITVANAYTDSRVAMIGTTGSSMISVNSTTNAPPTSSGTDSLAVGSGAASAGQGSTAVGNGAVATGTQSVALGAGSSDGGRANVVSVGAVGSERQVTNVAPGVAGTDAVNVNQLNNAISNLQGQINSVARNAYAGVASALAVRSAPYVPGKNSFALGTATYRGYGAIGLSLRSTSDNGRWSLEGGVSTSAGGTAAYAGVAGVF